MSDKEKTTREKVKIGALELASPLVLAPLAGYTIPPFRSLCSRLGAALTVTEMISAAGLLHASKKSFEYLEIQSDEGPVAVQIFGSKPKEMATAARHVSSAGFALVDINMGCPVPKVTKSGAGSALLKDHAQALRVAGAVLGATDLPVTVKIRLGWDDYSVAGLLAKLVAEGISAITVHGRTRAQGYSGQADWDAISRCHDEVAGQVPLFGNGDLNTPEKIGRVLDEKLCEGVQLARGALTNPWLFRSARTYLAGNIPEPPRPIEVRDGCLEIFDWLLAKKGIKGGVPAFRGFFCQLIKGRPGSSDMRRRIYVEEDPAVVKSLLDEILQVS